MTTDLLPNLPEGSRILFVRLRSLGDTILSTPLYRALKSWRPDLRISVLVESPHDEVLHNNPDLHQVISIRCQNLGRLEQLKSRIQALRQVRAEQFECCINLHGGSTSAWITRLSRARHRVGLQSFRNAFAYNHRIELPTPVVGGRKQHTVQYQIEWLRRLGLPPCEPPPLQVFLDPRAGEKASRRLASLGVDAKTPYCAIQPASKFYTKQWTAEGFAEVADHVAGAHGLPVLLIGGPGEDETLHQVASRCRSSVATIQVASISELAWIFKRARVFIGNDSGPTHLAAALGVPVVVIFGSSDSQVWHPWKSRFELVQNRFDCNPCPGYRCLVYSEPQCILSVEAGQVKAAADAVLRMPGNERQA